MKLPELILTTKVNQHFCYTGIDSFEQCLSKQWFLKYPHQVEYQFNERGFRDQHWPSDLDNHIWCVGDSFTVGLGSPIEHTWPYVLSRKLGMRCINVGMDGASNDWISQTARYILDHANPLHVICMWSFVERRQLDPTEVGKKQWKKFYNDIKDIHWPDCDLEDFGKLDIEIRKEIKDSHHSHFVEVSDDLNTVEILVPDEWRIFQDVMSSDQENIDNFDQTTSCVRDSIINATIPDFADKGIYNICRNLLPNNRTIPEIVRLDFARDSLHFDIKTSEWVADQLIKLM